MECKYSSLAFMIFMIINDQLVFMAIGEKDDWISQQLGSEFINQTKSFFNIFSLLFISLPYLH